MNDTNNAAAETAKTSVVAIAARLAALNVADADKICAENLALLAIAVGLGADDATIAKLAGAYDLTRESTILIPIQDLHRLSRGKGWCRRGTGKSAAWGKLEGRYWRVGPGRWTVQGHDGFKREKRVDWVVEQVKVGPETWLIAR